MRADFRRAVLTMGLAGWGCQGPWGDADEYSSNSPLLYAPGLV